MAQLQDNENFEKVKANFKKMEVLFKLAFYFAFGQLGYTIGEAREGDAQKDNFEKYGVKINSLSKVDVSKEVNIGFEPIDSLLKVSTQQHNLIVKQDSFINAQLPEKPDSATIKQISEFKTVMQNISNTATFEKK
jgi:hypothetical protein